MLTYEAALQRILKARPTPQTRRVRLEEALGLVLERPIVARGDLPNFDNSAVDGYALRTADVPHETNGAQPATVLRVIGTSAAGRPFRGVVRTGQAVRTFTGAQVPRGTDAVVMQEHVMRRQNRIIVQRSPKPGQHIRRRGEDLRRGARVLAAGMPLRPQELGLLAALGYRDVSVYRQPTVAILTTGDEVMPPGTRLKAGQIYESNGTLLSSLVQQAGARAVRLGVVRDVSSSIIKAIRRGSAYDVLLIAGGVSVGEKDFVRQATKTCGITPIFWRVNIKPGMPLLFGTRGRTLVFGLPGNPVSVFVTFAEFVKPALVRLMGRAWQDEYSHPAVLVSPLTVSPTRRTHFIRVRCSSHNQLVAEPLKGQGSHQLHSLVKADGWIRMIAGEGPWHAGTRVLVKPERAQWSPA